MHILVVAIHDKCGSSNLLALAIILNAQEHVKVSNFTLSEPDIIGIEWVVARILLFGLFYEANKKIGSAMSLFCCDYFQ
jgi:hypothetical protein